MLPGVSRDLVVAVRSLRATPLVTTVAILSLALTIGANTAIFSIISALVLRTLPVRDPGRLVHVTDDVPIDLNKGCLLVIDEAGHEMPDERVRRERAAGGRTPGRPPQGGQHPRRRPGRPCPTAGHVRPPTRGHFFFGGSTGAR